MAFLTLSPPVAPLLLIISPKPRPFPPPRGSTGWPVQQAYQAAFESPPPRSGMPSLPWGYASIGQSVAPLPHTHASAKKEYIAVEVVEVRPQHLVRIPILRAGFCTLQLSSIIYKQAVAFPNRLAVTATKKPMPTLPIDRFHNILSLTNQELPA